MATQDPGTPGGTPDAEASTAGSKAAPATGPTSGHSGDITDVKFLTVAEVAAMMRVSKMTVYRLVHNGELAAVRVGRSFRVSEKDVNDYLRSSFFQAG